MNEKDELNLNDYLRIIGQNKRLIVLGTLLCVAAAGILSLILPRIYESHLILEVGRIYLPPARDKPTQDVEFLEEPKAAAEVLRSSSLLFQVREELGLDIRLDRMRRNLEVVTFPEERGSVRMGSPIIELIYRGNPPEATVGVLELLAADIIDEHTRTYEENVGTLRTRVRNLEGKIADIQWVVDQQQAFRDRTIEQTNQIAGKIAELDKRIQGQDLQELSNVEAIFLNSAASNQERILSSLNDALSNAEITIGENQEKIGDYRDEIANLSNLANLCRNTRVRGRPMIPEKPIRPKKSVNMAVGGLLGLALTLSMAFFREYSRT